jgi:hypothetical protein
MADRPPARRHGAAAELSPEFMRSLEALAELIEARMPEGKSFALFVIHHPSHGVSLISEHSPREVAKFLTDWYNDRKSDG